MYKFIPWRKIRTLHFFLIFLSLLFVKFYLKFPIQKILPKKLQKENYSLKLHDCYSILNRRSPKLCISKIDKFYCRRLNLVVLKIDTRIIMLSTQQERDQEKVSIYY